MLRPLGSIVGLVGSSWGFVVAIMGDVGVTLGPSLAISETPEAISGYLWHKTCAHQGKEHGDGAKDAGGGTGSKVRVLSKRGSSRLAVFTAYNRTPAVVMVSQKG
eukprot:4395424-Pyramimonas_sp.AAC.1